MLDAIAATGADVAPYLSHWVEHAGESGARQLADFVFDRAPGGASGVDCGPVDGWLAGPVPARILESAVMATTDPQAAADLSDAYELIMASQHR